MATLKDYGIPDEYISKLEEAGLGLDETITKREPIKWVTVPPPVTTQKKGPGLLRTLFRGETGFFDTVIAGNFLSKQISDLAGLEATNTSKLIKLYRETKNPELKDRIKTQLDKKLQAGPTIQYEQFVPESKKTTSQVLAEAGSVGLLVTSAGKLATLGFRGAAELTAKEAAEQVASKEVANVVRSTNFFKRFYRGGAITGGYSALQATADEGTIREKLPEILVAGGVGFLGGGILSGTLPPLYGKVKDIWVSKMSARAESRIAQQTWRYEEVPIGVEKFKRTFVPKGVAAVNTNISRVERKLDTLTKRIEDLNQRIFIAKSEAETIPRLTLSKRHNTIVGRAMESRSSDTFKKRLTPRELEIIKDAGTYPKAFYEKVKRAMAGERIRLSLQPREEILSAKKTNLEARIARLEEKRTKLVNENIGKDLKVGDWIIESQEARIYKGKPIIVEKGRGQIVGFGVDNDTGSVYARIVNANGDEVLLYPEQLAQARKIIPPKTRQAVMVNEDEMIKNADLVRTSLDVQHTRNWLRGLISLGGTQISKAGPAGRLFARTLSESINRSFRYVGKAQVIMRDALIKNDLLKNKLTAEEIKNLQEALISGARVRAGSIDELPVQPINNRVRALLQAWSDGIFPHIQKLDELGLVVRDPVTSAEHAIGKPFFTLPHALKDPAKLQARKKEFLEKLIAQGETPEQALKTYNVYANKNAISRYPGIERARRLFLDNVEEYERFGFETNPFTLFNKSAFGLSKRRADVELFGPADQYANYLKNEINRLGYDDGPAIKIHQLYKGILIEEEFERALPQMAKTFQLVTKLPLGAILNSTQFVNPLAAFGAKNTLKGFIRYVTDKEGSQRFGALAGVTDDLMRQTARSLGATGDIAENYLRSIGFTSIEKFNRHLTGNAMRFWAQDALKALIKNPANAKYRRQLGKLGIDNVDEIIARGKLTEDELVRIAQAGINATQFRNSVLDIPLFWQSPWGQVATQFKSFSIQQGKFTWDWIITEAGNGNFRPFFAFLLASQFAGEAVQDIKHALRGDIEKRIDMDVTSRLMQNQISVGGFGLISDAAYQAIRMQKGGPYASSIDFLGGPTISDVRGGIDSLIQMRGIEREALEKAPILAATKPLSGIPGAGIMLKILSDWAIKATK